MRQRMDVYFAGRVQGVGFRYTTQQLAKGFDVTGSVRNLPDGRVELIAEGDKDELEAFLEEIGESGVASFIKEREVAWTDATGEFRGFRIAT